MINPYRVEYASFSSLDFDLICDVAFDQDSGATSSFLSREAVASETYRGDRKYVSSYKYTESFAPVLTFVDKNFGDFTMERQRKILKWLTSKDTPSFLNVYHDDSSVASYCILGAFTSCDSYKLANGRVVGFQCTFTSIMPYALSDICGHDNDGNPIKYNPTNYSDTTMYYWTTNSSDVPYCLTETQTLKNGTKLYKIAKAPGGNIVDSTIELYDVIASAVNGVCKLQGKSDELTLTSKGIKTKRTYNNKITLNIDTDDNQPVCPRVTINHGYDKAPHTIVPLLPEVKFNSIVDMAGYVENTVYHNEATGMYYYKSYTPQFTFSATLPQYVNWTVQEVDQAYTSASTFAQNTFYHYAYEGKYYWKVDEKFYEDTALPFYGDWKTSTVTRAYTANDVYEDKTIYAHTNNGVTTYYWISTYNFYSSKTPPSMSTTSVKITNRYYDFLNNTSEPTKTIVTTIKNNTGTEKIVLDGANRIISSDRTRRIFGDDFVNWQWLELYDGKNELTIEGNCEVTLEYRTVIKCGEF